MSEYESIAKAIRRIESWIERQAGHLTESERHEAQADLISLRMSVDRLEAERSWTIDRCHSKDIQIEALRNSLTRLIEERQSRPINRLKALLYRYGILDPYYPGH